MSHNCLPAESHSQFGKDIYGLVVTVSTHLTTVLLPADNGIDALFALLRGKYKLPLRQADLLTSNLLKATVTVIDKFSFLPFLKSITRHRITHLL